MSVCGAVKGHVVAVPGGVATGAGLGVVCLDAEEQALNPPLLVLTTPERQRSRNKQSGIASERKQAWAQTGAHSTNKSLQLTPGNNGHKAAGFTR